MALWDFVSKSKRGAQTALAAFSLSTQSICASKRNIGKYKYILLQESVSVVRRPSPLLLDVVGTGSRSGITASSSVVSLGMSAARLGCSMERASESKSMLAGARSGVRRTARMSSSTISLECLSCARAHQR